MATATLKPISAQWFAPFAIKIVFQPNSTVQNYYLNNPYGIFVAGDYNGHSCTSGYFSYQNSQFYAIVPIMPTSLYINEDSQWRDKVQNALAYTSINGDTNVYTFRKSGSYYGGYGNLSFSPDSVTVGKMPAVFADQSIYKITANGSPSPVDLKFDQYLVPSHSRVLITLSDIKIYDILYPRYNYGIGSNLTVSDLQPDNYNTYFNKLTLQVSNSNYSYFSDVIQCNNSDTVQFTFSSDVFPKSGEYSFTAFLTDSRGVTATIDCGKINFVAYDKPSITDFSAVRCDHTGEAADEGTGILIRGLAAYDTRLVGNSIKTELYLSDVKKTENTVTDLSVLSIIDREGASDDEQTCQLGYSYKGYVQVTDGLGEIARKDFTISRAYIFMRWDAARDRFGFGVYPAHDKSVALGDDWTLYVDNIVSPSLGSRELDLSEDLTVMNTGEVTLQPNVITYLPDMMNVFPGYLNIHLEQPRVGTARKWEFFIKTYGTTTINFPQNVIVPATFAMRPNTYYHFTIIRDYLFAEVAGDPALVYLYDSDLATPTCNDVTGGWNLEWKGLYNRTPYAAINAQTNTLDLGWTTGASNSYVASCAATENKIPFKRLLDAGYTALHLTVYSNKVDSYVHNHLIVSSKCDQVIGSYSTANMTNAYGTYVEEHRTVATTPITLSIPLSTIVNNAILEGYVSVRLYGTYNGGTGANIGHTQKIWIE